MRQILLGLLLLMWSPSVWGASTTVTTTACGGTDKVSAITSTGGVTCTSDADSGGATAYDAIGNPTGAGSISFDDGETAEYDGANDNEIFMTISLNAGDLTGDTEALLITAVDNDDANYIPLLIQDDQDGTPDNLFLVDYQGNAHLGGDPADQGIIRLTNASIIAWEDGTETTLTHVDNTGLLLNTNLTAATINSTGNFQTNANILSPNALTIYTTGGSDDIIIDANSGGAADIALGVSGDVDTINMYGAVTTDGNLTIGSAATLDVNTGTLDNVVTLNLTAGGLSDNSIEANDMVHEDHGEITYAGGSAVVEDSLAVTSWTLTTPLVSGKSDADAGAVNDDSCVGEQGLWWYDDTDSQFEFCNADSGAPVALPTTAGDITSVFDVASGAVTDILVASGESITVAAEGQIESTEIVVSTWNDTGAILYACTAVYISGFNVPNDLPTIAIADSDNAAAMPALGLVEDDIADGAAGHVVVSGHHDAWDTAGLTVGNELYVNTSGTSADNTCSNTLTATRPTGITTEIQKVGSVMRVNPANGEVEVSGAGRSNDVPNLQDDYFWLGNGSNVATAVQMSSEATIDNAGAVTLADSVAVTSWNLTTPTFTTTALLAGILQDNDDMVFEVDANNDGSNKYSFTDGASAEIASLTEAGLLTVIGGVDLGTSQALVGTTAMTIGDNGQTVAVNSSDWDIGATGIATGMGNITSDGTVEGATITEGGNAVPNVTDNLSVFAATSSAQLYGVLNDETGSAAGAPLAVFSVNPTLTGLTAAAATYDFGAGSVVVELPNEAAPTTDATGEIALDTTIVDHQPLWQYYDGGENMTIIAIDTAELPALDNEIVKYNAGTDKFVLEADAGGGSGAFSDAGDPIVQNTTTKDVQIGDGAGTLTGKLEIGGDADQPQLVVEGNGTQTDSLIIAQTDADVEVFTVDVSGLITTDDDVKHADSAGASTWTLENLDQDQDILIRNDDGGSAETSIQVHGDNGIITFAEQSAARAYLSANQLNLVSGTYTKILFDAETFDIQSEFDSTTNNRFDAIEAGMYQINTCVSWTSVVANKQYALVARVNGSNVTAKFSHSGNTTVGVSTCVSDVVELAASDYVEVWGRQLSGVNTVDVNGSEDITFLTVAKIH